jgi:hypothetical protein
MLLGERQVRLGRVEGHPEDLGVLLFEFRGSVTEPLALRRSTRGVRGHVPPQHHPPALKLRQ